MFFLVIHLVFHKKSAGGIIRCATGRQKLARLLETVILRVVFRGNFTRKVCSSCCYHMISVRNCLSVCIFLISWFAYLAYISVQMVFSLSHLSIVNMLVLYVWCLPKISNVMLVPRLLFSIFQNLLDSSFIYSLFNADYLTIKN